MPQINISQCSPPAKAISREQEYYKGGWGDEGEKVRALMAVALLFVICDMKGRRVKLYRRDAAGGVSINLSLRSLRQPVVVAESNAFPTTCCEFLCALGKFHSSHLSLGFLVPVPTQERFMFFSQRPSLLVSSSF